MSAKNAELKCTWTNGLIWMGITAVVSLGVKALMWLMLIYNGDTSIYFDGFCMSSLPYLLLPTLMTLIWFTITYQGYMKRAAKHPEDLRGVAHGRYGRPWILGLVLQFIVGLLWIVVSLIVIKMSNDMDFGYEIDILCFRMYVLISGIGFALDLVLYLIGAFMFQPNLVKQKK